MGVVVAEVGQDDTVLHAVEGLGEVQQGHVAGLGGLSGLGCCLELVEQESWLDRTPPWLEACLDLVKGPVWSRWKDERGWGGSIPLGSCRGGLFIFRQAPEEEVQELVQHPDDHGQEGDGPVLGRVRGQPGS